MSKKLETFLKDMYDPEIMRGLLNRGMKINAETKLKGFVVYEPILNQFMDLIDRKNVAVGTAINEAILDWIIKNR